MENQEIIFRLGMLEQQLQQLQQQMQAVERGMTELQSLDLGLDEITGSKDKEILAQIGKGIFIKAKVLSEDLTVNVGDNNFVKKDVAETKVLIQEQIKKLREVEIQLEQNIEATNNEFLSIAKEYQENQKSPDSE
jgi:prefoldin alpha subunit